MSKNQSQKKIKKTNLIITIDSDANKLINNLKLGVEHFNINCENLYNSYENMAWFYSEEYFHSLQNNISLNLKYKQNIVILVTRIDSIYAGILKEISNYLCKKKKNFTIISSSISDKVILDYMTYKNIKYIKIQDTKEYKKQMSISKEYTPSLFECLGVLNTIIINKLEERLI